MMSSDAWGDRLPRMTWLCGMFAALASLGLCTSCHGPGTQKDAGTYTDQLLFSSITLPQSPQAYAMDLNGSGHPRNQFGSLVQAFSSQGMDWQGSVNASLDGGEELVLLDLVSSDVGFRADPQAVSDVYGGMRDAGVLAVDPSMAQGRFTGPLQASAFDSASPFPGPDVTLTFPLFIGGSAPVLFKLHGGHLAFTLDGGAVVGGQLNGAILEADLQRTLIPGLASSMNAQIQASPSSTNSQQLLGLFDVGNGSGGSCTWPVDGTTGVSGDGIISNCEVADNSLVSSLLVPDVQMFDGGLYAPSPANTQPDSVSFGVGFTAGPATFQH